MTYQCNQVAFGKKDCVVLSQTQLGFTLLSYNTLGMSTRTHFTVLWIFISRTQCCYRGVPFRHGYFISFFHSNHMHYVPPEPTEVIFPKLESGFHYSWPIGKKFPFAELKSRCYIAANIKRSC